MIKTEEIVKDAMTKALEKMAFLTITPPEEEENPPVVPGQTILAEIDFSGPKCGCIQILAGEDFAGLLADNISAGEETDEKARLDAMQELSNVVCGLVIPMLSVSPLDIFDVTVPTVTSGQNAPKWGAFTDHPDVHILNVEGFAVAVRLVHKP